MDSQQVRLFELKLQDIYNRTEWLQYELPVQRFIDLFAVEFKDDMPQRPDLPEEIDLDRDTRLAILVAFREAFT